MRQARAGPGGRTVPDKIDRRRLTSLRGDERRAVIAVAKLSTEHLVRLALLDLRHAREVGPRLDALRRVVADVRLPHRAPLAPPERCEARGRDHVGADLAT